MGLGRQGALGGLGSVVAGYPHISLKLAVAGYLLGALACTAAHQQGALSPPMVFIHGIKGSTLVDGAQRTSWLTPWQALGLSTPDLALPMAWDGNIQIRDGLTAKAPLQEVTLVPGLVAAEVYGPWLRAAQRMGHPFYAFAYDWRRDNLENTQQFVAFLQAVAQAHHSPIRVIAHSMGGLITLAVLNDHPEYFHDVVFAGVPFRGGIGFLKDMHEGLPVGLNWRILAPEVLFTFPAVYSLFPLEKRGLIDARGQPLEVNFFSATTWKAQKLGVFSPERAKRAPYSEGAALTFLQKALDRARVFRELLVAKAQAYPPILVVYGAHLPTLETAMLQGPHSVASWDFVTAPQEPGDGRVSANHAMPPSPIPYRSLESNHEHADLLNDPNVIAAIGAL